MDYRNETLGILRVVEKVVGFARRGIVSPREAVNKVTDELAYYRRGDLAGAVLPLLTPELSSELRAWVGEALSPGYRYRWYGLGSAPSEDERLKTEAELIALASRLHQCGVTPAESGRGGGNQPMGVYRVWFTNITGCAVGISDISWSVTVSAESEATAVETALEVARVVNCESGLPPHGLRVSEQELRRLASVLPGEPA